MRRNISAKTNELLLKVSHIRKKKYLLYMECEGCGKKDFCSRLWRLYHITHSLCGIKDISIGSKNLFRVCPHCQKDEFRSAKGFVGHITKDVCLRREERARKRKIGRASCRERV